MFKSADICRATHVSATTLSRWLDRRAIVLGPDDIDARSSGTPRLFSRTRAIHIAIVHALAERGVGVSVASRAAAHFTDQGQDGRAPGELFAQGPTTLIVGKDSARVINGVAATDGNDVMLSVDIGALVARVDRALHCVPRIRARERQARRAA